LLTPPVGMVLYVLTTVADISFDRVVKATLPFLIPLLAALAIITIWPGVVTFVPRITMGWGVY